MCDIAKDTIRLDLEQVRIIDNEHHAARLILYNNAPVWTLVVAKTLAEIQASLTGAVWLAHVIRCHPPKDDNLWN